jgi:hypothetical protein
MKCPKCKYSTFDYVGTCPRCGKDMSEEKSRLNIFSIKPNTPFMLGSLTGDLNDSSASFVVPDSVQQTAESMKLNAEEIYDDGSELNINIDEEAMPEPGKDVELESEEYKPADVEKELELDFDSDESRPPDIEAEEDIGEIDLGPEERERPESVSEAEEEEEESEVLDLDLEDLDLKLDLDVDEEPDK